MSIETRTRVIHVWKNDKKLTDWQETVKQMEADILSSLRVPVASKSEVKKSPLHQGRKGDLALKRKASVPRKKSQNIKKEDNDKPS